MMTATFWFVRSSPRLLLYLTSSHIPHRYLHLKSPLTLYPQLALIMDKTH
ncbi:hypothetical protein E2C01_027359 [Portunus trituberculatus]|uniref:Uncharacterized protein n=1 Tax=Portunus trituberculatus TaxID=210409 RepID=A0A5B7EKX8_PORTR|nr:hypothetical protein [Portunus trituberculatus]